MVIVLGQGAVVTRLIGGEHHGVVNGAHLLLLVLLQMFGKVRVTVDEHALHIAYGYLGWPHQRIALERVASARAFQLQPLEHGGWGYRGSVRFFKRAALVVRSGPALGLELTRGQLSITVDDAERGARVINSLLARRDPPAAGPAPVLAS